MRLHPLRSFTHIHDPSGLGTEFIEEGLLNPDFGSRMDAGAAAAQAMTLKFSGGQARMAAPAPAPALAPAPVAAPAAAGQVTEHQRREFLTWAQTRGGLGRDEGSAS